MTRNTAAPSMQLARFVPVRMPSTAVASANTPWLWHSVRFVIPCVTPQDQARTQSEEQLYNLKSR